MDKLCAMKLFARVVDAGSFTAVADELNGTTSMVSKEAHRLEKGLVADKGLLLITVSFY